MNENNLNSCSIFFCGKEKCDKSHFFGPAVRNQYLLHYIVSGKGCYKVDNQKFNLSKGEFFLIKPKELTYYQADDKEPWEYMWVAFDGYEAKKILLDCGIEYVGKTKEAQQFEKYMNRLIEIYELGNNNEYESLSVFYGMMSQLFEDKAVKKEKNDKHYYNKAIEYIYNNFAYSITVNDISKYIGIERSYLYKIFIKYAGISPKQYIFDIRMKTATKMLKQNNYTITQIAISVGFNDVPSFCNQFKKLIGVTPNEYRKTIEYNKIYSKRLKNDKSL